MIYPKFLNNKNTIGICAPSAGIGNKEKEFNLAIKNLKKNFNTIETNSVRNNSSISNTKEIRGKEFNELITNKNISLIMCATGGDYLIDILPFINYKNILNNPKWIMGYSDPTNLLYTITTNLDIATIYGHNAASFSQKRLHKSLKNNIEFIKGNIVSQTNFKYYEKEKTDEYKYNLTESVYWEKLNTNEDFFEGRIIGGCLDCLMNIIGTKYDGTKKFINKYKNDKIIWYFDIFSLSSEDVYRTLWQMQELGYFKYTNLIIIGRVKFPKQYGKFNYQKALKMLFKDKTPIIFNADIGHVHPQMTIINGAYAKIWSNKGKGKIEFELK